MHLYTRTLVAVGLLLAGCSQQSLRAQESIDSWAVLECGKHDGAVVKVVADRGALIDYSHAIVDATSGKIVGAKAVISTTSSRCVSRFSSFHRVEKLGDSVLVVGDDENGFVAYFHGDGRVSVQIGDEIDAQRHSEGGIVYTDSRRRYYFASLDTKIDGKVVERSLISGRLANGSQVASVFGVFDYSISITDPIDLDSIK